MISLILFYRNLRFKNIIMCSISGMVVRSLIVSLVRYVRRAISNFNDRLGKIYIPCVDVSQKCETVIFSFT